MQTENPQLTVEQAEAQARLDYRWVLEDERGRRVLRAVLRWSGIEDTGPVAGIEALAAAAGSRMVGNILKAQIRKHDPEGWIRLETEFVRDLCAQAEQAERAAGTEKTSNGAAL